jgi:hypothetical protein
MKNERVLSVRSNLDLSALNLDQLNLGSLNSQQNGTGSAY